MMTDARRSSSDPDRGFDPEEALRDAEFLIGAKESWPRVEELAVRVLDESSNPALLRQARRILERLERAQATKGGKAADWASQRDSWAGLSGLDDGRLDSLWSSFADSPQIVASMRGEIERSLSRWIQELVSDFSQVEVGGGEDLDYRLQALGRLMATSTFRHHFEMPLRQELSNLEIARFQKAFQETEPRICQAISRWWIAEARELLEDLGEPPPGIDTDPLEELREKIAELEEARRCLESSRGRLEDSGPIETWGDLRRHLDLLAEARWLEAPPSFAGGLTSAVENVRAQVRRFIADRVSQVESLEDVEHLARKLAEAESRLLAAEIEISGDTLNPAATTLEKIWRERLVASQGPEELDQLSKEIAIASLTLPDLLQKGEQQTSQYARKLREIWQAARSGRPLEALPSGPVPELLAQEYSQASQDHDRIIAADRLLEKTTAGAREAKKVARQILQTHPKHHGALRLIEAAKKAEITFDLDHKLEELDSGSFDWSAYEAVASWNKAPAAHRALCDRPRAVQELARLLPAGPLSGADEAATWWTPFVEAVRQLPEPTVPWLHNRLEEETRARRAQWGLVLDRCLAQERGAAPWRRLAEGLEIAAADPRFDSNRELERYRIEILRRSELARIGELLDKGQFERAGEALPKVAGDPERQRYLEVRLAVERPSSDSDFGDLAEALQRHWGQVCKIYGSAAFEKLLAALEGAWAGGQPRVFETLLKVARRARKNWDSSSETGLALESWMEWADLESRARNGLETLLVQPLMAHLGSLPDAARRQRLQRLLDGWGTERPRRSRIWAFRAFPKLRHDLFPDGVDPLEEIVAEMKDLEVEVEDWIGGEGAVEAAKSETLGVTRLRQEVIRLSTVGKALDLEVRELGYLLAEVPFPVEWPSLATSFTQALTRIESVLTILDLHDKLAASDLRAEGDRMKRCRAHTKELPRSPWRKMLLRHLDKIEPLTRLTYDENRVWEAARKCGSRDALDSKGVFSSLAKAITTVVEKIEVAGCSQAPVATATAESYWQRIPRMIGDRTSRAPDSLPTLVELLEHLEVLELDDRKFFQAIEELSRLDPPLSAAGRVSPGRHESLFGLVPKDPPKSNRAFWRCARYLEYDRRRALFESGLEAGMVPEWVSIMLRGDAP